MDTAIVLAEFKVIVVCTWVVLDVPRDRVTASPSVLTIMYEPPTNVSEAFLLSARAK